MECVAWLHRQAEIRVLTDVEILLQRIMKTRHNQLVLDQEEKWRQRSKQTWVKAGDKNTRFFHQMASLRKRSNHVDVVVEGDLHILEHKQKARAFFQHFTKLIGTHQEQPLSFEYQTLYENQSQTLLHLEAQLTQQEVEQAVKKLPHNKAPGPDGYTGEFFKSFMDLLLPDLMATYKQVMENQPPSLYPMNTSYIALIPKKKGSCTTNDFRPISLIHSV